MSIDGRRTSRIPMKIPVEISFADAQGRPRLERTHTLNVDRHGTRVLSDTHHPPNSMIHLGVPHIGRSAHCRVVWCSAPVSGWYEVGLEIEEEANFWGLQNEAAVQGVVPDYPQAFAMLVQILQEKGVIRPGELDARLYNRGTTERPSNWPQSVVI